MKSIVIVLLLGLMTSCSFFNARSDSEVMNRSDGEGIFVPQRDFPVMEGDPDDGSRSYYRQLERTPLTKGEKKKFLEKKTLIDELVKLEHSQSERLYRHYLKYRDNLDSLSEKIYFLKMGGLRERNNFLESRGIIQRKGPSFATYAVSGQELLTGMKKRDVVKSWGRPSKVDIAGNPEYENERWAFMDRGRMKYVYFENGIVRDWTD